MKKKFNELKIKISQSIKEFREKLKEKRIEYMDLAPSDSIDDDGVYTDALNWAIKNDKITNIALTGNYGSGKSSIIKTFKKRMWHNNKSNWLYNLLENLCYYFKYKSLSISLATFINDDSPSGHTTPQLQEIEKSILQQMFYSIKGRRIPSSRFKQINHLSNKKILSIIVLLTTVITLGLCVLNPIFLDRLKYKFTELKKIILNTFFNGMSQSEDLSKNIALACYIIFFIGCLTIFYYVIKYFINTIKLGKINISNFEIEIDTKKDNSIFNEYLDEIIYFFQVCRHNLVFIEDLDRFNSVSIFTKLRELNTLINNSEQIRRKVVFIYAIKDDMFLENKERTKFFDFIVPVIPVINASNSNVELMKKLKEMNLSNEMSEEFIDEIAIFIDDMRILKSVVNEFYIYKEKLKNNNRDEKGEVIPLEDIKMLSIIIYKNLFPKDFSLLQLGDGLVHEAFMNKDKFLIQLIKDLDNRTKEIEEKILCVNNELLYDQEELSLAFKNYIRKYLSEKYGGQTTSVGIGDRNYNISDNNWIDIDFSTLNDSTLIKRTPYGTQTFSLKELHEYFKLPYSFSQRSEAIKLKNESKQKELHNYLKALKTERHEISSYTLSKLIEKYGEKKVLLEDIRTKPFIVFLLRNGYIDEQHQMYISYFHEGSLTISDASFVLNIKYRKYMEPTYKLNNKEKIIEKLNLLDFSSKVILNYDLLNYLLESIEKEHQEDIISVGKSKLYIQYYNTLVEQLVNNSETHMDFIYNFNRKTVHKQIFIKTLCNKSTNIWDHINSWPLFSDETKNEYLKDILLYANINDLQKINTSKGFSSFIENNCNFLRLFAFEDSTTISKVKEVIDELPLKFKVLDVDLKEHTLFEYICNHNFYVLNPQILKAILHNKLGFDPSDIDTKSYSIIMNSKYEPVKSYVKQNIEQYVKDIILANSKNTKEPEESILDLLNEDSKKLSLETKIKLIQHCDTLLSSLNKVDRELWNTFISEQKLVPSWENIAIYYTYISNLDNDLCKYLNNESNYLGLAQTKLNSLECVEKVVMDNIAFEIIHNELITDKALRSLIDSIEIGSVEFDFKKLSDSKTQILIECNQVLFNMNNYTKIRNDHRSLLIIFLEKHISEFLNEFCSENTGNNTGSIYTFDNYDTAAFLRSRIITDNQKIQLIKCLDENFVCIDVDTANLIIRYILNTQAFEINKPLLSSLLDYLTNINNKISLLTLQIDYLSEQQIFECLDQIGDQYSKIGKPSERLKFDETVQNTQLFNILKQKLEKNIKVIKKNGKIHVNSK